MIHIDVKKAYATRPKSSLDCRILILQLGGKYRINTIQSFTISLHE